MPGITGIISKKPAARNEVDLDKMLESMAYEPFFSTGRYVNSDQGLYIGWTCHRGSFSDCMPIANETRGLMLFFAGEDFANLTKVQALKAKGHGFETHLDAGYLIHLFEEDKDDFFDELNGFFHGLIADLQSRKFRFFNDRYGMRRLYYYEGEDEFLFSSELKSILRIRPELREIDPYSLGEFFSCGCVLNDRTLFKRVFTMPAGSVWTFSPDNTVAKRRYFTPTTWESQPTLPEGEFFTALSDKLKEIVPRYLQSRGRIGLSLTGGLDTRMILASAEIEPGTLPCFTFGGMYRDSFDVKVSRQVAAACKQPYQVLRLDPKFLSDFPKLAEKTVYISDGMLDITGAPNLYVNNLARTIADIRLTGNYGQEVLRRYIAFRPNPPVAHLFDPDFIPYILEAKETWTRLVACNRLTYALFKQAPWYQYGRFSVEDSQLVQRSPFMDNELVRIVYSAPQSCLNNTNISWRIISDGSPKLRQIMTDRGAYGALPLLLASLIRANREVLFKLEYYYNHGMPQWGERIDYSLRSISLERLFLGRHKYYHMRSWLRHDWSEYLRDVLLSPKTLSRNFINKAFLREMVERHIKGDHNYTDQIVYTLTVELMHRMLIEGWK